jgi:hypothetical protein
MALKKTGRYLLVSLLMVFVLFPSFASAVQNADPSLEYNVKALPNEYMLNKDGKAQGKMDIELIPKGTAKGENRQPIDVMFVFDKSGSMGNIVDDEIWQKFSAPFKECNWYKCSYSYYDSDVSKFLQANPAVNEAFQIYLQTYPKPNDSLSKKFEKFSQVDKLQSAKNAVTEALKNLGNNPEDNLQLIPFDADIGNEFNLKTDIQKLYALEDNGGTNYGTALQKADDLLKDSNRNKYVIFLTDGFPTNYHEKGVKVNEHVYEMANSWSGWYVTNNRKKVNATVDIYYDNNGSRNYAYFEHNGKRYYYGEAENKIRSVIVDKTKQLAAKKIKMYSIGFGGNNDLDLDYLNQLSNLTGLNAVQGTGENINNIFRNISDEINQLALSEVQLRIKLLPNVSVPSGSNVLVEDDYAYINMNNVPYTVDQPAPQGSSYSLPLEFSANGTYTFNDIQLTYKDIKGKPSQPISHPPVTIYVKPKTAPSFEGTMAYRDSENVGELVKQGDSNSDKNKFHVDYSLKPLEGFLANEDRGTLSNIRIVQTLPKGFTVLNADGTNIKVIKNGETTEVEMKFPNVTYTNKSFSPSTAQKVALQLQADWAMNQKLPNPVAKYKDSNFGDKELSIQAPSKDISMLVRLIDGSTTYEGNRFGKVTKIFNNTKVDDITLTDGQEEQNGPVKSMTYKQGSSNQIVEVTYSNDKKASVYLTPDFEVIGQKDSGSTGNVYKDKVKFRLSQFVTGSNVTYQYRLTDTKGSTQWTLFNKADEVSVDKTDTFTIEVRAIGGFAKENVIISKTVTVGKKVTSIQITPNPVVLTVGQSASLQAIIQPDDAFDKRVEWSSLNSLLVQVTDKNNGMIKAGLIPGKTEVKVRALDGSNAEAFVEVTVRLVGLESMKFKYPSITLEPNEEVEVKSLLKFNPSVGVNTTVQEVVTAPENSESVKIDQKPNGEWVIKAADDSGYATVTATAEEKKSNGEKIEDSIVVIVKKSSSDSGNNGNNDTPNGKW